MSELLASSNNMPSELLQSNKIATPYDIDDDELTSSSILEFLSKEQECCTEADAESIFQEVSRLADNSDTRSVDEILREAELLIQQQSLLNGGSINEPFDNECKRKQAKKKSSAVNLQHAKSIEIALKPLKAGLSPSRHTQSEKCALLASGIASNSFSPSHEPEAETEESNLLKEGLNDNINNETGLTDNTNLDASSIASITFGLGKVELTATHGQSLSRARLPSSVVVTSEIATTSADQRKRDIMASNDNTHCNVNRRPSDDSVNDPSSSPARRNSAAAIHLQRSSMTMTPDSGIDYTPSTGAAASGGPVVSTAATAVRTYCDRSVNCSPKRMVTSMTSPLEMFASSSMSSMSMSMSMSASASASREYTLKQDMEKLQEKLKDTEERLQSLRIQNDTLSQLHRDMRDCNGRLQEESEMLKLDVQHLNDCANVLRTELQAARTDRSEALEMQKQLQAELDEAREEKKRSQESNEKDGKIIQDLQRQCREMERILMRKHPDSVSALIVAAKNPGMKSPNSNDKESVNSRKLLEQRIAQLEADAKEQDLKAQEILANVQARFNSVQSKYETHIADLETQVLSLQEINTKLNEKIESQIRTFDYFFNKKLENQNDSCTQTDDEELLTRESEVLQFDGGSNKSTADSQNHQKNLKSSNNSTTTTATQTAGKKTLTRDHSTNTIGALHHPQLQHQHHQLHQYHHQYQQSASSSTSSTTNSTPNTSRPNSKQSGLRKPLASAGGMLSSIVGPKLPISQSDSTITLTAKEDANLLATIRDMRIDLAIKEKAVQRLTRELDECKKTIRKLQKEKDALKSDKPSGTRNSSFGAASRRTSDVDGQTVKDLQNKIKLLEADYKTLHDKRLQDLKTLQTVHEREMASCHEAMQLVQQRLNECDDPTFGVQKRRKMPVDYYALKAKVSSLERRHTEREKRLRLLVDALSKGRLNNSLEDIIRDNT